MENMNAQAQTASTTHAPAETSGGWAGARAGRLDPGVLWLLASAAGFGSMAILAKLAYSGGLTLPTLLATRFGLAAVLMWGLLAVRRLSPRVPPRTLLGLLLMGGIGYVGQSFAFFTALQTIPAATTALLLYTYPAMVSVLAWMILKQRISRTAALALALATAGCVLVVGGPAALPAQTQIDPAGMAWGLAAALIYSLYIIAGTRITANVPPLVASTYIISAAAGVFLGAGWIGGTLNFAVDPGGWAAMIGIALICTVLAIAAFFAGLARLGPGRASILSTVEPVVTFLLAALVLGESISLIQIAGGALILSAVLVLHWPRKPARPPAL
jgi:drug/metabolite transporter (DMT)-like permease